MAETVPTFPYGYLLFEVYFLPLRLQCRSQLNREENAKGTSKEQEKDQKETECGNPHLCTISWGGGIPRKEKKMQFMPSYVHSARDHLN